MISNKNLALLNKLCPDFAPYQFLKSDLYKGKISGGHNIYYKLGEDGSEGVIIGKTDYKRFDLQRFPYNFTSYGSFNTDKPERGWSGEVMTEVLEDIIRQIGL